MSHRTPSVQFSSVVQSCLTLCDPMNRSTPGLPVHHQLPELLKLLSIELVMPSSHLILCHPLLLLPPVSPSIRVFSNESTLQISWRSPEGGHGHPLQYSCPENLVDRGAWQDTVHRDTNSRTQLKLQSIGVSALPSVLPMNTQD